MKADDIRHAATAICALRKKEHPLPRIPKIGQGGRRREIDIYHEQRALIDEVRALLPGQADRDEAIAWLDANCPWWRNGPAPRGSVLNVESGDE